MGLTGRDASIQIYQTLLNKSHPIPLILVELAQESRALYDASHEHAIARREWNAQVAVGRRNFYTAISYYIFKAFQGGSKGWFTLVRSFLISQDCLLALLEFFKAGDIRIEHFYYPWGAPELNIVAALYAVHELLDPHWYWILPSVGVHQLVPAILFPFPPTRLHDYITTRPGINRALKVSSKIDDPVASSSGPASGSRITRNQNTFAPSTVPSIQDVDQFAKYIGEIHAACPSVGGFMQKVFDDYIYSCHCSFELPDLRQYLATAAYFRDERRWDNAAWVGDTLGYKIVTDTLHRNHPDSDPQFYTVATRIFAENKNLGALLRARGYVPHDQHMKTHDRGTQAEAHLFLSWETVWRTNPEEMIKWSDEHVEKILLHLEQAYDVRAEILRWESREKQLELEFPTLLTWDQWKVKEGIVTSTPHPLADFSPERRPEPRSSASSSLQPRKGLPIRTTSSTMENTPLRLASRSSSSSSDSYSSNDPAPSPLPFPLRKANVHRGGEKENVPPTFNTRAASSGWSTRTGREYHPYRKQKYHQASNRYTPHYTHYL